MERLTLAQVACFTKGILHGDAERTVASVSTDSRSISNGGLFIPLVGEYFDGHDFIGKAVENGAAAALTQYDGMDFPIPLLQVEDTSKALKDLAREYKKRFTLKTVGITGSVGKTTTKEMVAAVLGSRYNTIKTEGNLNNEIGLPLTVLRIEKQHEAAVLEMGMSNFGEISRLTNIASPDIAIITSIGVSHIEFLKSREGILKAKLEILEGLTPGGVALFNGDEPLLWNLKGKLSVKTFYFGTKNPECDFFARDIRQSEGKITFSVTINEKEVQMEIHAVGTHNVGNAMAAVGAGILLGVRSDKIQAGLLDFQNAAMRQNISQRKGFTIIEDCYNASPDSVKAALTVLESCFSPGGRKIAVLGGMRELGDYMERGHFECGEAAADTADLLFLYGEGAEFYRKGALNRGMDPKNIFVYSGKCQLTDDLKKTARHSDILLFKGSRAMKMEEVLNAFLEGEEE